MNCELTTTKIVPITPSGTLIKNQVACLLPAGMSLNPGRRKKLKTSNISQALKVLKKFCEQHQHQFLLKEAYSWKSNCGEEGKP